MVINAANPAHTRAAPRRLFLPKRRYVGRAKADSSTNSAEARPYPPLRARVSDQDRPGCRRALRDVARSFAGGADTRILSRLRMKAASSDSTGVTWMSTTLSW